MIKINKLGNALISIGALFVLVSCGGSGSDDLVITAPSNNIAFVTSTTQDANIGSLTAADAICNTRAAAAGLDGTYVAWLSTNSVNAKDRLGTASGWVRTDGKPLVDTVDNLLAGKIYYPLRLDEFGADVGNAQVMTGTANNGTVISGRTCSDWTDNGAAVEVQGGYAGSTTQIWTGFFSSNCTAPRRLYCFGVDYSEPVSPPDNTGRIAFLSNSSFAPDTGLAAADTICANEATSASLPGTYKALMATDSATAASRFTLSGSTWVRPDGVAIVELPSDLTSSELIAPVNVSADGGSYRGNNMVWMGAVDFNTVGSGTSCTSWGSTTGSGAASRASMSIRFPADELVCSNSTAGLVYCLQE